MLIDASHERNLRVKWLIIALLLIGGAGVLCYAVLGWQRERNTKRLFASAQSYERDQQWDEARNAYRLYLRRDSDNVRALTCYVDLLLREVDEAPELIGEAARALQRLTQLDPRNPDPLRKLTSLYLDIREFATAETLSAAWLELEPACPDAAIARAAALQGLRRDAAAADVLMEAIVRAGNEPRLFAPLIRLLEEKLGRATDAEQWLERALAEMGSSPAIQMAAFELRLHRRDLPGAEGHLARALVLAPNEAEVLARAINFFVDAGRLADAGRLVDAGKLVKIWDRQFLLSEAAWTLRTEDPFQLQHTADRLIEFAKRRDFELIALAAELYLRSGRLEHVDACIDLLASGSYGKATSQLYIDGLTGARALFAGEPYAAIPRLEAALRRQPSSRWAMELLAAAYQSIGAMDEAAELYRRVLALSPEADSTRLVLAELLLRENDCTGAVEQTRQLWKPDAQEVAQAELINLACSVAPSTLTSEVTARLSVLDWQDTEMLRLGCRCLILAGQPDQAVARLARWLKTPGTDPTVAADLNNLLLDKGHYAEAKQWAAAMCLRNPHGLEGHLLMTRALAGDQVSDAEEYVSSCDLPASVDGELWLAVANAYLDADQDDFALGALHRARTYLPDDVAILRAIVRQTKDAADAESAIGTVRDVEGDDGVHWRYERAWLILSNESAQAVNLEAAKRLLQECVAARPAWTSARLLLALAQEVTGDLPAAAESYRRARAQKPQIASDPTSVRFIEVLKQLGRFDEADMVLEQLAAASPESTDVLRLRLDQYLRERRVDSAASTAEKLLLHDEHDPAWIAVAADLQLRAGNAIRAEELSVSGLQRNPGATSLLWSLAQALVAQQRAEEALSLLSKHSNSPGRGMPALLLARLSAQLGQPQQARESVDFALRIEPGNPSVHLAAAELFAAQGDRERQLECVKEAARLQGIDPASSLEVAATLAQTGRPGDAVEAESIVRRRLEVDPADTQALLLRADLEMRSRAHLADAERTIKEALSTDPRCTHAYRALAALQVSTGRADEAAESIATALLYRPDDPESLEIAAQIEMHRGAYVRAIPMLKRLLEYRPRLRKGQAMLADAFIKTKEPEAGIREMERGLANAAPEASELVLLARLYEAAGRVPEAEDRFVAAVDSDVGAGPAFGEYAQFLARQGRFKELQESTAQRMDAGSSVTLQVSVGELLACQAPDAEHRTVGERWLRDVVFSGSEQSSLAAYRLGLCLHRRGDVMHAETMFLKALREDPAASSAANALAWLYSEELGQPARAIELLDRFARDGGEVTPDMHDTYAAALIRMGSFAAARHRLLKCLPLAGQSPTISAANYRLGVVMMETGEPDAGRAALRHALELDRELGGLQDRERSHARRLLGQAGTG